MIRPLAPGSAGRILVVDDSHLIRAVLRAQLCERGYEIVEADDGVAALALLAETDVSAVLLDLEMPRMDGHGVLAAMRADERLATVPVVFLTGRAEPEDVAEGLRRGAHDYLRKPFEPAELIARVSVAVRTKALQDELRERNRELERLSETDALTGLHNRRYLEEQLEKLVSRSARHERALSLLLVDVDRFKAVNDNYGHQAGDAVLCAVARRLQARLRTEDVLGRWGGEEFLVLLPDSDRDGALTLADGLRRRLEAAPVVAGGASIAVTASFGAAAWEGETADRLLRRADEALYAAKADGRNLVRMAA